MKTKKYRIVPSFIYSDGTVQYNVEKRFLFFWRSMNVISMSREAALAAVAELENNE